ncbi:uncharacterized protein LOC101699511 [Heterocephalus glaber]|uniref:Uncharacterized protein LOC101699511 n=1 Tax=Heterocephalus glaber TaxID=10181 RepID=A0AAX6PTH5_HETGA|nr:uncharacterized protein LOC101699511 [Heterocephalus glaber]
MTAQRRERRRQRRPGRGLLQARVTANRGPRRNSGRSWARKHGAAACPRPSRSARSRRGCGLSRAQERHCPPRSGPTGRSSGRRPGPETGISTASTVKRRSCGRILRERPELELGALIEPTVCASCVPARCCAPRGEKPPAWSPSGLRSSCSSERGDRMKMTIGPGNHGSAFCLCGFACSGHFLYGISFPFASDVQVCMPREISVLNAFIMLMETDKPTGRSLLRAGLHAKCWQTAENKVAMSLPSKTGPQNVTV